MRIGLRIAGKGLNHQGIADKQQYYEVAVFAEKWQCDEATLFATDWQKAAGQWPDWYLELMVTQQSLCNLLAGAKASNGVAT